MEAEAIAAIPDEPLRTLTWALLATFALSLPALVALTVARLWRGDAGFSGWKRPRNALFAAIGVGAVARFLVPPRMVMHYMGYELFGQAARLGVTPKYGPAAFQLEHAVLRVGGMDAVFAVHALVGALLAPMAAVLLMRLGASAGAVAWAGSLVALAPVLIRDAASESMLVHTTFWALGAAVMLADHVRSGRPLPLLGAGLWALLAMLGRPEMLGAAPLLLAAVVVAAPSPRRVHFGALGLVFGVVVAVLWLRADQLQAQLAVERLRGNTPRVFQDGHLARVFQLLREAWWDKNGLLWSELFPAALPIAIAVGGVVGRGRPRRLVLLFLALTLAWLAPSALDLPWVSVPRVQAPAMLLGLITAGVALEIVRKRAVQAGRLGPSAAAAALALAVAATAAVSVKGTFRTDHTDVEHTALTAGVGALPAAAVVVARSHDDAPDERVHLAMPGRAEPLEALLSGRLDPGRRPVYAWLGTRCWMRPCAAAGEHPACAAVRARFKLETGREADVVIAEARIPDTFGRARPVGDGAVADLDFPWCLSRRRFRIGLYRVSRPADGSTATPRTR